jgi:hypothetical protein
MKDEMHSQEDLSHLVNQLTGSFLAFQAILRGMINANRNDPELIKSVQESIQAEQIRIKGLIPGEFADEFEQTI